jgi:hypothetical protein
LLFTLSFVRPHHWNIFGARRSTALLRIVHREVCRRYSTITAMQEASSWDRWHRKKAVPTN